MNDMVRQAAQLLRDGGLVAFATETVYGLGADARNSAAVRKIFAVKGRPAINPLIVHVADRIAAKDCASYWPESADVLARAFWPGPLTLVVPRHPAIVPEVSAGLDTVGLRAPDHPVAQSLLQEFAGPIAAPSANRSNRISPTTAQHVRDDLADAVDFILDGGPCLLGIESTVVDVTSLRPTILRPGSISRQRIAELIGEVDVLSGSAPTGKPMSSPGQQDLHYAPATPAFRFAADQTGRVVEWHEQNRDRSAAILVRENSNALNALGAVGKHRVILMPADAKMYAARLYSALRDCDSGDFAAIWVEEPPDSAEWTAVRDRIFRATRRAGEIRDLG